MFNFLFKNKKKSKKVKRAFTLIEILAVIIILGILVIIAIPAVTRYIEDSRRSAYIDTARQIIAGARNLVNSGDMDMYNADATYYLPISCIKSENSQKSINGDFTLAYVGVTYNGSGYEYYWTSVDKEGEGIKVLTSYDDLNEDKIESGIKLSDIDTTVSVGGKSKTLVYNNDCTEIQENEAHLVVTLDGNDGEFSNGQHTKQLKYPLPINVPEPVVKYSHTSNINDNGEQLTNYNNNWTNANITGTDRGDTSQAHVVTIPGASSLHVKIIYGGESSSYDWVCMWKGSHPEYTAYNNYSSSITGKLGGGNHTAASNTKEYDVDGDTVTFGFRSDVSVWGDGYGYYAVVTPKYTIDYIGTYEEPKRDDYLFDGWEKDGKTYEKLSNIVPKDNETYDAKWKASSKLIINPNGGYIYVDGVYVSSSTTYTKKAGESLTYSSLGHSSYTYSNGSWTITYNSNGGSTTPASKTAQVYYTCAYTFNNWNLSGDCDNVSSTTSTSSTYTFPDDPGGKCTMSASWTGRCGSNYAYSYTLPAAPTKAGYRFLGWKSSATGAIYPASSTFYPTQSETLTAQWEKSDYTVTFDANGGSFSSGSTSTNVTYTTSVSSQTYKKYSYTQNLNQNGNKSSNYGNNWTNSYIRGTDRTSSNSQAHVVTIPGATDLTVEVYYNGESTSYDWVTLWAGSHPSYTASSYYSYGVTNGQKLGGACYGLSYYVGTSSYYYSNVCKRTFGITGDTVSFGFKSDGSEWGDGFGYYATVSGTIRTITANPSSSIQTPTRSGYRFTGWKSSLDNQIYTNVNVINNLNSNITMTAQWEEDNGGSGGGGNITGDYICVRANTSTLHTEKCNYGYHTMYYNTGYVNSSCYNAGYYSGGSKGTDIVTYGNKNTTIGVLNTGDAFDCDVNNDGTFDPETERFYYVSDYYDTQSKMFDSNYATLVYSTNFTNGVRTVGGIGEYFTYQDAVEAVPEVAQGSTSYPNYVGPVTAVKHLPKTTLWRNDLLKTNVRRIYSEDYYNSPNYTNPQTTACYGQELPAAFSYGNCAARLLTVFEVSRGCIENSRNSIMKKCEFLLEGTKYVERDYGSMVWFENPTVSGSGNIFFASTYGDSTGYAGGIAYTDGNNQGSIKPAIDVPKSKIYY